MSEYIVIKAEQRSPEWFVARLGCLTSSVAGDMLATIARGEAAGRRNLRVRLALERLTGVVAGSNYTSAAMQAGIDREPAARLAYEAISGELVEQVGFVRHTTLMVGASPDGVVFGPDGRIVRVLELKSPQPAAHLDYLKTGDMGAAYRAQVLHTLWVTGAESCHWMSYCPEFPEWARVKFITVERDNKAIAEYESKALLFLEEVEREVAAVEALRPAE